MSVDVAISIRKCCGQKEKKRFGGELKGLTDVQFLEIRSSTPTPLLRLMPVSGLMEGVTNVQNAQ